MNPIGSYYRLEGEMLEAQQKLGLDAYITFGILFVDARQSETKEYIINYMNSFDRKSREYFEFFIPGYVEDGKGEPAFKLKRTTQEFFFDDELFDEFCEWSEKELGIEYTYNPMLVLISVKAGKIGEAQKIVIELDNLNSYGVKRSGIFFREIFKMARLDDSLQGISHNMERLYVKGNLIDLIINSLGQDWLVELKKTKNEIRKFKIKER